MTGHGSFLRSPKKEEHQVPDTLRPEFFSGIDCAAYPKKEEASDDLEGFWGIEDKESCLPEKSNICGQLNWDILDWEGFSFEDEEEEEEGDQKVADTSLGESQFSSSSAVKREVSNCGFWEEDDLHVDDDEKRVVSLNLSLNYQEVMDAWSDRGPPRADELSFSVANIGYMGEVPVMEEEDRRRREASVLRYKEKRQNRLFSKKIRYQVRKLNADKRPRLKGRFVKRVPEKIFK